MGKVAETTLSNGELTLDNLFKSHEGRRILTCIQCGTCSGGCPYGRYMTYLPRRIIAMLQIGLLDEVLKSESFLYCITCYTCMTKCPRDIKLTEILLPLIKEKVLENLEEIPHELQLAFQNTLRYGNPFAYPSSKRTEWLKTLNQQPRILSKDPRPTEVLWFVECYPAFTPRGQDNSRAVAKLLDALKIDYAILGNEEWCTGECIRLAGEKGLFENLTEKNLHTIRKYKFNTLLTGGAHAYDAFLHTYPKYGFNHPVEHTTTFFAKHIEKLKPKLKKKLNYVVTYHDSCVLGRHNKKFEEPRLLLEAIPGIKLKEMVHTKENSICCGGGGGGMWLDTYYKSKGMERLSDIRIKEAIATGADVLAVSCPYEISRFEDSLKLMGYEKKMQVKDVVEILAEALGE